jgi:hypothetical protein
MAGSVLKVIGGITGYGGAGDVTVRYRSPGGGGAAGRAVDDVLDEDSGRTPMKKKTAAAIVALVVAAVLGGSVSPAAAVSPCGEKVFNCDSHWMDPGPANGE